MASHFTLPDGRVIDYLVSGAEDGFPLVWIHGTPGAYISPPNLMKICKEKGIKVISASRAGYGGSSRNKGRRVVDAVADLAALNEHLGVKKCLVGGLSGGGPHSLACAARLPGCVGAACIAGPGPYGVEGLDFLAGQGQDNVDEFSAAIQGEPVVQKFCQGHRPSMLGTDPEALIEGMASLLPEVDRKAITADAEFGSYMVGSMHEALRDGVDGWVDDDLAFVKPWGFDLSEIKVPVLLYQGTEDKMVPYAHGQWLAEKLPQDKLEKNLQQGEGHVSIFETNRAAMIDRLLEIAKSS